MYVCTKILENKLPYTELKLWKRLKSGIGIHYNYYLLIHASNMH